MGSNHHSLSLTHHTSQEQVRVTTNHLKASMESTLDFRKGHERVVQC